jgi:hypothetical protein
MKKCFMGISIFLSFLTTFALIYKSSNNLKTNSFVSPIQLFQYSHIDNMPVISDHPYAIYASKQTPIAQRGIEYIQYLAPSLKINVSNASGSGTIIFYDAETNYAYVQSCGHLWRGNMSASEHRNVTCTVETWYHNNQKLETSQTYRAEVLWYSNTRGRDGSLLRFHPDWIPDFFPLADKNYQYQKDSYLHSLGCDSGREVAHYDVKVVGLRPSEGIGEDLISTENSPRPGRSGGGLLTTDGYYVGICWGTSDVDGSGIGFFTPLSTVKDLNTANGFGWLNDIGKSLAREIPIQDRNNPQGKYPKEYIPLPGGRN